MSPCTPVSVPAKISWLSGKAALDDDDDGDDDDDDEDHDDDDDDGYKKRGKWSIKHIFEVQ